MRRVPCGQETQFLPDQRQESVRSLGVPQFDGVQDVGNVRHADCPSLYLGDGILPERGEPIK